MKEDGIGRPLRFQFSRPAFRFSIVWLIAARK